MKIHVLTLNWNGNDLLKNMIPGLLQNLKQCNMEYSILIRDNGSNDDSISTIKSFKDIQLYKMNHNRDNFAKGVNFLFDCAKPSKEDIILLLNNDIQFNDDTSLNKMLKLMNKPNTAIVGSRLTYDKEKISHDGVIFSSSKGNMPWHFREGQNIKEVDNKNRYFQAVTAACCLIKSDAFIKAGKLDQNLHWAFEDIALNLDVSINQNKKIICCSETNITHTTSNSLKKNPVNKLFLQHNVSYFKKKWYGKYKIDHENYNNKNYNLVL